MKKKYRAKWLDRRIAAPAPYLTLCLSKENFSDALRDLDVPYSHPWIKTDQAQATTHHMQNDDGEQACIVCLDQWQERNPIEVAGLLVHEAVHVWQAYCHFYGETQPGVEQEAYGIQAISQELMAAFAQRLLDMEDA